MPADRSDRSRHFDDGVASSVRLTVEVNNRFVSLNGGGGIAAQLAPLGKMRHWDWTMSRKVSHAHRADILSDSQEFKVK